MHEILEHEADEGERALDDRLVGLGDAQQEKGDQGDRDLDAHGIFGRAEEMADLQGLLDETEEQFDGPAALVEIGDLPGRGIEVVGQDAQYLARVGSDGDLAHRIAERVAAVSCLARRQVADAIGQDGAGLRNRLLAYCGKRRMRLEPGDDPASGLVHPGPPAEIVIAEIEDIGCAGHDRHGLGGGDVVDPCGRDRRVDRPLGLRIVDDVDLGAAGLPAMFRTY